MERNFRTLLACYAEDAAHSVSLTGDLESLSSPGNREGVVSHAVVGLSCLRPSIVRAGAHNARPMCGRDQTCPISNYISGGLRLSAASGSLSHGVAGAAETSHGAAPTISRGTLLLTLQALEDFWESSSSMGSENKSCVHSRSSRHLSIKGLSLREAEGVEELCEAFVHQVVRHERGVRGEIHQSREEVTVLFPQLGADGSCSHSIHAARH